jgi:hypothetical protein
LSTRNIIAELVGRFVKVVGLGLDGDILLLKIFGFGALIVNQVVLLNINIV